MENILNAFSAVGGLALIIIGISIGIAILLYPILFDIQFKADYGKSGISYWWTAIQIISILGTMPSGGNTDSDEFTKALGFTIIIFIIAITRNYKRIKKMGLEKSVCIVAALAQAIAPFGIAFILILISGLFEKQNNNEKNNKRKM